MVILLLYICTKIKKFQPFDVLIFSLILLKINVNFLRDY